MLRARRLILGGVFTVGNFELAMEAVKIMQQREPPPRDKDGNSALQEIVFTKKDDGSEVRFLGGFVKDDAIVYFAKDWMASKEYGSEQSA